MKKCDICKQEKVWAIKRILKGYCCTDCIGHIAFVAKEIGVLDVRKRLDAENEGTLAIIGNNTGGK